jgi:hypothetical protein
VSTALISKSLRNALREFLVGLTVREIRLAFEAAGVVADLEHLPTESGERRRLVEQHYHTLDFTAPADARRFVAACEESMAEAARLDQAGFGTDPRQLTRTRLLECLQRDGFRYEAGKIAPASPDARRILGVDTSMQSVSEITRRGIFDEFRSTGSAWCGRLSELEFLNRLYNLSALPSEDSRHKSMEGDVTQHRVRNRDWDDYWVFDDPRLNLLHSTDESFLRFLVQMVDPVVRQSASEVEHRVHRRGSRPRVVRRARLRVVAAPIAPGEPGAERDLRRRGARRPPARRARAPEPHVSRRRARRGVPQAHAHLVAAAWSTPTTSCTTTW